jgi:hypothetical protein
MGSRDEIYYWKCDCEISEEDKKRLYLSSKYDDTTMLPMPRMLLLNFSEQNRIHYVHSAEMATITHIYQNTKGRVFFCEPMMD